MTHDLAPRLHAWSRDAEVTARLRGGQRSDVWLCEIEGERCVARRSSRSHDALAWELELIEHLRSQGVGVPRVIPTREGRLFDDNLVVFSFVEGRRPIGDREWRRVADELRRIHGMTRGWPQRPTFASTQDLLTRATGGDVDLRMMPDTAVSLCREAWRSIGSEETSAIHGDPLGNVLISDSEIVFIDWDETRVDASLLDLADLPLTDDDRAVLATVRRAANAWEAACSWVLEPDYARRRLENLS